MKGAFLIIIWLFLLLFNVNSVHAIAPFVSIDTNPLIFSNDISGWSEQGSRTGVIIKNNDIFKILYTSVGNPLKIGYALSTEGKEWTRQSILNLYDSQDVHDPSLVRRDLTYDLFFTSTPVNDRTKIFRSHVLSENFDNLSIPEEILIPEQQWEINAVAGAVPYFENTTTYLFYSGHNLNWSMGLAYSNNKNSFIKCENNPILENDVTPTSIIKEGNMYILFFHSPNGIEYMETDHLGCDSEWKNRTVALPNGYFPYVIKNGNDLWMYYATNNTGSWKINLAISKGEEKKKPIILIPGMFSSWNKEALFYGKQVAASDWHTNPIVTDYEGLEDTLVELGYRRNSDYYVYPYDWRASLNDSADTFDAYLNSLNLAVKPMVVGHSLGGMVGRIYLQKHGAEKIEKLITVGSPHKGTAKAYGPVEAGEIEKSDPYLWLAQKLTLQLYRNGIKTDKQIIEERLPVIHNLLPVNDYLKKNDQYLSVSAMKIQNNSLPNYVEGLDDIFPVLTTIAGNKGGALSGFRVGDRSIVDQLLDLYSDGRPLESINESGDYMVTVKSALVGAKPVTLALDHGELMYSKEGIAELLKNLNIPFDENQIKQSRATVIFPSLIFLMLSPAKLEVEVNGQVYEEKVGMVFIENPPSGPYTLRAKGMEKGTYTILIGQMDQEGDDWGRIEGEIVNEDPSTQTDTYTLNVNMNGNTLTFSPETQFDQLSRQLQHLNKTIKNKDITKALSNLEIARNHYVGNRKGQLKSALILTHKQILAAFPKTPINQRNSLMSAVNLLEILYSQTLSGYNSGLIPSRLKKTLEDTQRLINPTQKYLLQMKQKGKQVQQNALLLMDIEKKLSESSEKISEGNYNYAEILLKSVSEYIGSVRKL